MRIQTNVISRSAPLLIAAFVVLALGSPAGAEQAEKPWADSSTAKTIGTRGEVVEISADGARVAIHAQLGVDVRDACEYGSVWTPASGAVVRFPEGKCSQQSDTQFVGIALAGSRAAWVDANLGNHFYCQGPYTATLTSTKPVDLGECPFEDEGGDIYWDLLGDGSLLVGRSYLLCEASCEPDFEGTYETDVEIWRIDSGAKRILAAKDDTKLLDVEAGVILLMEEGTYYLLDRSGKKRKTLSLGKADGGGLSGSLVVTRKGRELKVHDAASGALEGTWRMAAGGKLQEVDEGFAVYVAAGAIHLLRLADGRDRVVATVKGLVEAELEPAGLFYAWNDPKAKGDKPGRVTFVPSGSLG